MSSRAFTLGRRGELGWPLHSYLCRMDNDFISSYRCWCSMCLLVGIPRALARASVSKDGSRASSAPWIPLPWRLSANSWGTQSLFKVHVILFFCIRSTRQWLFFWECLWLLICWEKQNSHHWPPTHLQVYIFNPLDYSVTCPNKGVPVLMLALGPPGLQSLWKHKNRR